MGQGDDEEQNELNQQLEEGEQRRQQHEKCYAHDSSTTCSVTCWDDKPKLFEEIHNPSPPLSLLESLPDEVETYITSIEPRLCKSLLKELGSFLPLVKVEDKMKMVAKVKEEARSKKLNDDGKIVYGRHDYNYSDIDNIIPLGHLRRVRRSVVETQKVKSHLDDNSHDEDGGNDPASTAKISSISTLMSSPSTEPPLKRSKQNKSNKSSNNKTDIQLEVLVGPVTVIDHLLSLSAKEENSNNQTTGYDEQNKNNSHYCLRSKAMKLQTVIETYNLQLFKKSLPGRPARSQAELDQWNNSHNHNNKNSDNNNANSYNEPNCRTGPWWPTIYFNKNSEEYKIKEKEISRREEYCMMKKGMLSAINDAKEYYNCMLLNGCRDNKIHRELDYCYGAVIMCPVTEKIISTSHEEIHALIKENCSLGNSSNETESNTDVTTKNNEETEKIKELLHENPLNTPVLFAIQGVSRKERLAAIDLGMDNDSFKNNQVNEKISPCI